VLPEAQLTHFTRGRLRLKIRSRKGDAAYFASLRDRLTQFPLVHQVDVNPLTGSILISHGLEVTPETAAAIADYTERSGLFRLSTARVGHSPVARTITETFTTVDNRIRGFTNGDFDLPTAATLGLAGFGLFQIGKGNVVAPAWYVVFWYATNIFMKAQPAPQAGK
jgi:hypothetical protein